MPVPVVGDLPSRRSPGHAGDDRRELAGIDRLGDLHVGAGGQRAVNGIDFIHVDFNDGKRALVWRRGRPTSDEQVVVLANFSDFSTPNGLTDPSAEYVVPGWPATPPGKRWREISRDRPADQAGREPIFPWEAKVYALVCPSGRSRNHGHATTQGVSVRRPGHRSCVPRAPERDDHI
jgi:hypothetical protein